MIIYDPSRPEFPVEEADVLVVDYMANRVTLKYFTQYLPANLKVLFVQYTEEAKTLMPLLKNVRTIVVQGFAKGSAQQIEPSPGHSRHLVHWIRHTYAAMRIVVVSNYVDELDADYLVDTCGADFVLDRRAFLAAAQDYLAPAPD